MLFAKGPNAVLRKGAIIKGGTSFEILESEVEDFKARGFAIEGLPTEEPESGNINMPPKENPGGKSENNDEEIPASKETADEIPKMGGASAKAKSISTASTVKKG